MESDFVKVLQNIPQEKSWDPFRIEFEKFVRSLTKAHDSELLLSDRFQKMKIDQEKCQERIIFLREEVIRSDKKLIDLRKSHMAVLASKEATEIGLTQTKKPGIDDKRNLLDREKNGLDIYKSRNSEVLRECIEIESACLKFSEEISRLDEVGRALVVQIENNSGKCLDYRDKLNQNTLEDKLLTDIESNMSSDLSDLKSNLKLFEKNSCDCRDTLKARNDQLAKLICGVQNLERSFIGKKDLLTAFLSEQNVCLASVDIAEKILFTETQLLKDVQAMESVQAGRFTSLQNSKESIDMATQLLANTTGEARDQLKVVSGHVSHAENVDHRLKEEIQALEGRLGEIQCDVLQRVSTVESQAKVVGDIAISRDLEYEQLLDSNNESELLLDISKRKLEIHSTCLGVSEQLRTQYNGDILNLSGVSKSLNLAYSDLRNERNSLRDAEYDIVILMMKLSDTERSVKQKKNSLNELSDRYDQLRSGRNILASELVLAKEEIKKFRDSLGLTMKNSAKTKSELESKQTGLKREEFDKIRAMAENSHIRKTYSDTLRIERTAEDDVRQLNLQVKQADETLSHVIAERDRNRYFYERNVQERDYSGAHLIHMNSDISLLQEKAKIQEDTLRYGDLSFKNAEVIHRHAVYKVRLGSIKAKDLWIRKESFRNMRQRVFETQRNLLIAQRRVRKLVTQVENPSSFGRWKLLEFPNKNLEAFKLKIRSIQARILRRISVSVNIGAQLKMKMSLAESLNTSIKLTPLKNSRKMELVIRRLTALKAEDKMLEASIKVGNGRIADLETKILSVKRSTFERNKEEKLRELHEAASSSENYL
jgi:hypothetical protein